MKAKAGSIAALVTAVTYVVSSIIIIWATIIDDGVDGGDGEDAMFISWCVLMFVGTIAAAFVAYTLLKNSGGLSAPLGKVALVLAVLAAIGSFFTWAWFAWGVVLSIAFALVVMVTRKTGSLDWAIPAAFPLGALGTIGLWATDIVEENPDGLDWAYTGGFVFAALVTAAAMTRISADLRPAIEAEEVAEA